MCSFYTRTRLQYCKQWTKNQMLWYYCETLFFSANNQLIRQLVRRKKVLWSKYNITLDMSKTALVLPSYFICYSCVVWRMRSAHALCICRFRKRQVPLTISHYKERPSSILLPRSALILYWYCAQVHAQASMMLETIHSSDRYCTV